MNQYSYRIDCEPAVRVLHRERGAVQLSLIDLFKQAHQIVSLSASTPAAMVAWHRILTALAYRIGHLDTNESVETWRERRNQLWCSGQFDTGQVDAYFDEWGHRFDLFDTARPWLQVASLAHECQGPSHINKLLPHRPVGENGALFGSHEHHRMPETLLALDPIDAVEALLIDYHFAAGGLCQQRDVGVSSPKARAQGPLRNVRVHLPQGGNLFESLVASMVAPISLASLHEVSQARTNASRVHPVYGSDLAEWESDLPDMTAARPALTGIIGLLANQATGAALLVPGEVDGRLKAVAAYTTWRYADIDKALALHDPHISYFFDKNNDKHSLKWNQGAGSVWQDSLAVLANVEDPRREHAAVVAEMKRIVGPGATSLTITLAGLETDGKAKDIDYRLAITPSLYPAYWAAPTDGSAPGALSDQERYEAGITAWTKAINASMGRLGHSFDGLKMALTEGGRRKVPGLARWEEGVGDAFRSEIRHAFHEALVGSATLDDFEETARSARTTTLKLLRQSYDRVMSGNGARPLRLVTEHRP